MRLFLLMALYLCSSHYATAQTYYDDLVIGQPENGTAWYNAGVIAFQENNLEKARDCFNQALTCALTPLQQEQTHYNSGNVHMKHKNFDGAIGAYESVLKINPKHAKAAEKLELARKLKEQQQQDKQQQDQKKNDQNQNKEQQQQNNQESDNKENNDQQQKKSDQDSSSNSDQQQRDRNERQQQEDLERNAQNAQGQPQKQTDKPESKEEKAGNQAEQTRQQEQQKAPDNNNAGSNQAQQQQKEQNKHNKTPDSQSSAPGEKQQNKKVEPPLNGIEAQWVKSLEAADQQTRKVLLQHELQQQKGNNHATHNW